MAFGGHKNRLHVGRKLPYHAGPVIVETLDKMRVDCLGELDGEVVLVPPPRRKGKTIQGVHPERQVVMILKTASAWISY